MRRTALQSGIAQALRSLGHPSAGQTCGRRPVRGRRFRGPARRPGGSAGTGASRSSPPTSITRLRPDSAADAAFCRDLCATLGVPFRTVRADVQARRRAEGGGLEEAARRERHAFLRAVKDEEGAVLDRARAHAGRPGGDRPPAPPARRRRPRPLRDACPRGRPAAADARPLARATCSITWPRDALLAGGPEQRRPRVRAQPRAPRADPVPRGALQPRGPRRARPVGLAAGRRRGRAGHGRRRTTLERGRSCARPRAAVGRLTVRRALAGSGRPARRRPRARGRHPRPGRHRGALRPPRRLARADARPSSISTRSASTRRPPAAAPFALALPVPGAVALPDGRQLVAERRARSAPRPTSPRPWSPSPQARWKCGRAVRAIACMPRAAR